MQPRNPPPPPDNVTRDLSARLNDRLHSVIAAPNKNPRLDNHDLIKHPGNSAQRNDPNRRQVKELPNNEGRKDRNKEPSNLGSNAVRPRNKRKHSNSQEPLHRHARKSRERRNPRRNGKQIGPHEVMAEQRPVGVNVARGRRDLPSSGLGDVRSTFSRQLLSVTPVHSGERRSSSHTMSTMAVPETGHQ